MSRSSRNSEKRSSRNDFYRGDNNKTERRTLFNPQSDNPLAFNTKSEDNSSSGSSSRGNSQRSYSSQRRRQGLDQHQHQQRSGIIQASPSGNRSFTQTSLTDERNSLSAPGRPSRGVLWDPNSKQNPQRVQPLPPPPPPPPPSSSSQQQKNLQHQPRDDVNRATTVSPSTSATGNIKKGHPDNDTTMTSEELERRTQIKTFLARIQKLQTKITQVNETTAANHPYFQGLFLDPNGSGSDSDKDEYTRGRQQKQRCGGYDVRDDDGDDGDGGEAALHDRHRQQRRHHSPLTTTTTAPMHPWLTMTVGGDDDDDDDDGGGGSGTGGTNHSSVSPLWKSTDQIWKDKMQLHLQLANAYLDIIHYDDAFAETKHLTSLCWKRAIYSLVEQFRQAFARQQGLAAAVAASSDDGSQHHATTTTMTSDSDMDDDVDDDSGRFIPMMTENGMTMVQLSDSEGDDDQATDKASLQRIMDRHLVMLRTWMDTFLLVADGFYQRAMVVLRDLEQPNDIVSLETSLHSWWRTRRWKWYRCIPYRGDLARYRFIYGQNKGDYGLAWRWYSLGVWMIPATGRFYFHQSLLLNSPHYSPLYELHKLYFGVRSLIVLRNGFVNARESLVTLFENNRQWYTVTVTTNSNTKERRQQQRRGRRQQQQQKQQSKDKDVDDSKVPVVETDKMISGLFIRLHGMLFTKINLDAFTQMKRRYFETLFPATPILRPMNDPASSSPSPQSPSTTLSCRHLFWFETIVLNLSSLYTYDYATSTLTKALTLHKTAWIAKHETRGDDGASTQQQQHSSLENVLGTLDDSILFGHSIDLICQLVVELVSRSVNNDLDVIASPALPALPPVVLNVKANETLLFGTSDANDTDVTGMMDDGALDDDRPWLIYIYVLLHWMVVTGIGVAGSDGKSVWERIIGQVPTKSTEAANNNMDKITRTFWPLLMTLLTQLLQELPEAQRYQLIDRHLLDTNNPWAPDEQECGSAGSRTWDDYIAYMMGPYPTLPEDDYLRGIGWLDDVLRIKNDNNDRSQGDTTTAMDMYLQRRIRILDYGFTLVKQMHQTLEYDPVENAFMVKPPSAPEPVHEEEESAILVDDDDDDTEMLPILTAMDDAVLFDSTNGIVDDEIQQVDDANGSDSLPLNTDDVGETDDDDDDGMMGQLKKRRQHLQSMLATMTEEKRHAATYGYQKLTMRRGKEREARLNRIREKVIPGQTVLVLDTNCFIGHMDAIRKLIQGGAWPIVIPLVVITELDGLKGNAAPLGTVAEQALQLIETALASKQNRRDAIRIQTSHHNFMYDISIRSEQFIFGETDKNLDDLILSTCLWWNNHKKQQQQQQQGMGVPVCLVTADRNLSVKARARDVQVIPVSGLMEINPSSAPLV
ncbi:hypothetical protein BCR42DRAFT_409989 [Absidia repens]|uniref:PIN domain-containing protein n=1 Tax=Absidia repens TaxID=90262 RepID=A0A1X2INF6_9FUNG|nr:hypothetical protein BCR42DRAFT_409989 [Absidia repens]